MEERKQENIERPISTFIVAFLTMAAGILGILYGIYVMFFLYGEVILFSLGLFIISPSLLLFFLGFNLFKKKRIAWWILLFIFSIVCLGSIFLTLVDIYYSLKFNRNLWDGGQILWGTIPLFISLIYTSALLIEKKKFWSITS